MSPRTKISKEDKGGAEREYGRKYGNKNYARDVQRRLTVTSDGRKLHLSGPGAVDILQESSESEEEVPPHPPPARRVAFANILKEAKTGTQNTDPTTKIHHQGTAVNSDRPQSERIARNVVHNWIPESHPAEGTEADRIREASIKRERDGYLRTTLHICEKQHVILVCQWSFSDPLNQRGTWSLEVHDFRRSLWQDDVGVEEHKQCSSLSSMQIIVNKLAKSMVDHWKAALPSHVAHEPDYHKRQFLREQLTEKLLPSTMSIECRLHPLAAYVMGEINRDNGEGSAGDKDNEDDKGEGKEKREWAEKSQKLTKKALMEKKKAARKKVELAELSRKMEKKAERKLDDELRNKHNQAILGLAQRNANGVEASHCSVNRRYIPKASIRSAAPLEMTEEHKELPNTKTQKAHLKKNSIPEKTKEEEEQLKSIRAAAREERKRQEQEEREEEERQRELAVQQDGTSLAATQEESPDDGLSAAIDEVLNDTPEPEVPKKKPTKKPQKVAKGPKSTTKPSPDEFEANQFKRRLRPCAAPVVLDSSDSDSVKPPQPNTPVVSKLNAKLKAKQDVGRPSVPFAKYLEAKRAVAGILSEAEEPKESDEPGRKSKASVKSKAKETKASKTKGSKVHTSEKLVANSDLEDDTTEDVKLPSDQLQSEDLSVETTKTTNSTLLRDQGGDMAKEIIELTTVAVDVQQRYASVERTEVAGTTTARSNSSKQGEATVEHTTHTQILTQLDVPHQELSNDSLPPSPEQEPQDGFNTPTNALGIYVTVPPPPPPRTTPTSPDNYKKRKRSTTDKPQPDQTKKKHKVTWSEDDGEVTISPSNTKWVKRV